MNLSVKDLKVDIATKQIVKGISLSVNDNEFIGLIGPNGSGKSTLLKAIYRVLKPSSGSVFLDGKDMKDINPKTIAKNLAVVSQFNNINFDFKVIDIVLMGRSPHKSLLESENKNDYTIATESLKKVGMDHYANRSFSSLSGGEKQRVILARALAQKPKILILDEPTNHLDIKYQIEILSLVKNLDICVLAALHDLTLASQYCHKLIVLKDGQIVTEGIPKEIVTSEMIKDVYDIDSYIYTNPITNNISIDYYPSNQY
ncbi:ABC transporter ATP-binding protein [uncultured Clostridium sp.]|uniref:ABC transporter ATP-binding protein n=1 Tax=uncultured Clostridium sp. TaxID=59620 RepID=UPI002587F98B|nr:ABC transporter ATP-binding protein [uncultured Clostridium sp.]